MPYETGVHSLTSCIIYELSKENHNPGLLSSAAVFLNFSLQN